MNKITYFIEKYPNPYLVIDFDHTITTFSSSTSIGVYKKYLGKTFKNKKEKIDYYYHKTNSKMIVKLLWYYKLKLLKKYYQDCDIKKEFQIRKEFIELFCYIHEKKIPLIIYSSGFDQTIKKVLEDIYIDYKLITNSFHTKIADIVTPFNKSIKIEGYDVIVIGDNENDVSMVKNACLKIGIKKEQMESLFDEIIVLKE